jgi:hypothetical protein
MLIVKEMACIAKVVRHTSRQYRGSSPNDRNHPTIDFGIHRLLDADFKPT